MAITFPLTPPTAFKTATARWNPMTVVGHNQNIFTGQQQTLVHQGQWWEVDLELPVMTRVNADAVEAFLLSLNGLQGTFWYGDRTRTAPKNTVTGTRVVNGAHSAGASTVNWSGGSGTLAVGDWIQIGSQLHRIVGTGFFSYDIFPRLRANVAHYTTIIYSNPKGLFRLKAPVPLQVPNRAFYGPYTIPLKEAF